MWWWIFFIFFTTLSIISTVLLVYALRRINQYEDVLLQIQSVVDFATIKMKQVDANGHYESDDETGFFFDQLKSIQSIFIKIFENLEEKDAKEKS